MHLPCTHMSVHTHERAHTHAHTHAYICTHMASSLQVFCDGEAAAGSRERNASQAFLPGRGIREAFQADSPSSPSAGA